MIEQHKTAACDVCGAMLDAEKPIAHVHMPLSKAQAESIIKENEAHLELHPMAKAFPQFVQLNLAHIRQMPQQIRVDVCAGCAAPFEKAAVTVAARLVAMARDARMAQADC